MPEKFMKMVGTIAGIILISGCASRGVTVQSYFEQKPRVDQALSEGNQGYLMGSPSAEQTERKATREIFVVEVSKEATPGDDVYKVKRDASTENQSAAPSASGSSNLTAVEAESPVPAITPIATTPTQVTYEAYKVDKDDTLQKIAKKFYNDYSKWPRIYEANKALIKNPDRIQPGITLQIPVEK
ncbi:MAG: LysM peptidoglycan-binding domain-containing protein [Candidatus Omnitrophica bacterium]|nr:LysM peptidoglycan-binding domain-containing protein [Candidatus Omnitrophota bacterium]